MALHTILGKDAFWMINKKLATHIGLIECILLSDFITKQEYFNKAGTLTDDGFFFNTMEQLKEDTGMLYKKQKAVISKLVSANLIQTKRDGHLGKLHFKVNEEEVLKLLDFVNNNEPDIEFVFDEHAEEKAVSKKDIDIIIGNVYSAYPSTCIVRGASTGKCSANKEQIRRILRSTSEQDLLTTIKWYIKECKTNNVYMKNFKTFLNNIPEIPVIVSKDGTSDGDRQEVQSLVKWLSINYTVKLPDEESTKAAKRLIELGYSNKDFLKRFITWKKDN